MWIMNHHYSKRLEETGLQCHSKNFGLKQLYTTFKSVSTKAEEYEVCSKLKILSICVAMCLLVMSLSSRDFQRCQ